MPKPRVCRVLLVVLAVVALGGSACGGGDGASPFEVVSSARAETLGANSARVSMAVRTAGSTLSGGRPVTLTGLGAYDFKGRIGTLTMDLSSLGLPGASGKAELVLTRETFYIKLPAGLGLATKPWLKVDLATLGEQQGLDLGGLQQIGGSDPTSALNYLSGVAEGDIEKAGKEDVRGEQTTHFRMTVDLERAKRAADAGLADDFDKIIAQLGHSTFPAELWVDGDNRVRRMRFTIDPADKGGTKTPAVVITEEFFDFGTEVKATTPPADQVTDFASLLGGATGG